MIKNFLKFIKKNQKLVLVVGAFALLYVLYLRKTTGTLEFLDDSEAQDNGGGGMSTQTILSIVSSALCYCCCLLVLIFIGYKYFTGSKSTEVISYQ